MSGCKWLSTLGLVLAALLFGSGAQGRDQLAGVAGSAARVSVKPLDLTAPPDDKALISAGQLGGMLYPVDDSEAEDSGGAGGATVLQGRAMKERTERQAKLQARRAAYNLSFGRAIQRWNAHNWDGATELFTEHLEKFPDSPWAEEAEIHLACEARYQGRYAEAEERYLRVLDNTKGKTSFGARKLANKARLRLGVLKTLRNNPDAAGRYFSELQENGLDWRERTYASHWVRRIAAQKAGQLALLNCGYLALGSLLEARGEMEAAQAVRARQAQNSHGQSLRELQALAVQHGLKLSARRLTIEELDAIPLPAIVHIQGRADGDKGHYWILERKRGELLKLHDPQSGRYFRQSADEFAHEWQGVVLVFTEDATALPGVALDENDLSELTGGCCGSPRPENDLGNPCSGAGECTWGVNPVNINLYVSDKPLWYDPPFGPAVAIKLSYNSQSALAQYEPFGNKWQFNYATYLVVDPGDTVTVFMPDGRRDLYNGDTEGNYTPPAGVYNRLANLGGQRWELRFLDDSRFIYDIPAGTNSMQPFLVEAIDPHGQSLSFGYNPDVQLTTITDAVGQVTTLAYDSTGLVEGVTDPFGRTASFTYDDNRNLTQITDMGGYWSRLTYDQDVYLTSIEKADGTWQFWIEPSTTTAANADNYPPPGDTMWANYRITITDPQSGQEEWFYYGGCESGYGCSGYSWYVSPRHYIPWQSQQINTFRSNPPKTRFIFDRYTGPKGRIARIQFPGQGQQSYQYDAQGNVTRITRPDNGIYQFTYNDKGRITSVTEPEGKVTNLVYAANGVDILSVTDSRGTLRYEYNEHHQVTRFTDRRGNSTALAYNNFGQLTRITAAEGTAEETTTDFLYNADQRFQRVIEAGATVAQFTYDTIGRIRTVTNADGLRLTYDFDDLNQLTQITYPDRGTEQFSWSTRRPFQLTQITSRGGKIKRYDYDPEKRLTGSVASDGGLTRQVYDADGNLKTLIDANSNPTTFTYDANDLVTAETYADGKGTTYTYDEAGQVHTRTNARGIQTVYSYDLNGNLTGIDYADDTPDVTFIYDTHNRLIQRNDGLGTTRYTYDVNDNLTSVDSPWLDDTITYTYDALDRRTSMTPEGSTQVSYGYDTLGRLASITQGSRTYTLTYQGNGNHIDRLTRPNGAITSYKDDGLRRLTEVRNEKADGTLISSYLYEYNTDNNRVSETVTNGPPMIALIPGLETFQVNSLNQLNSATNPARTYQYDADGNMTQGYTPAGYVWTAVYDAENRLKIIEYTDDDGIIHRTEYRYQGNDLVGRILNSENGSLVTDTRLIRDGSLVLQERDQTNTTMREYLWRDDAVGGIGRLLSLSQDGQKYFYLYGGNGNVAVLIDASENVVAAYGYGSFGELHSESGSLVQPFRFSTKYYNSETGLSDFGFRFYSAERGRWISRDPIGLFGSANFYEYVLSNPVNFIDPFGLDFTSGVHISGSTVNPFTSGGGGVWGIDNQSFYGNGTNQTYTYSGGGVGLDVGASIQSVWGWGDGPWAGDFHSVNVNFLVFSGSIYWSPGEGGWVGFTFGLGLGLPGIAYEETVYKPCN